MLVIVARAAAEPKRKVVTVVRTKSHPAPTNIAVATDCSSGIVKPVVVSRKEDWHLAGQRSTRSEDGATARSDTVPSGQFAFLLT